MATQYSVSARNNRLTQLNTDIGINCVIKLFSGAPPATCATADTDTLLVQYAGNATAFGAVASGVLTANAVATVNATASGTPGYYRIYPNAATTTNAVTQGTAGTTGTDMILTAATVTAGQSCPFTSLTITASGA